jgi:hypothetical protein
VPLAPPVSFRCGYWQSIEGKTLAEPVAHGAHAKQGAPMSSRHIHEFLASKPGFSASPASRSSMLSTRRLPKSSETSEVCKREARLSEKPAFGVAALILVLVACCLAGASGCQMPFKSKKASTKAGQEFSCGEHCPPAVP